MQYAKQLYAYIFSFHHVIDHSSQRRYQHNYYQPKTFTIRVQIITGNYINCTPDPVQGT